LGSRIAGLEATTTVNAIGGVSKGLACPPARLHPPTLHPSCLHRCTMNPAFLACSSSLRCRGEIMASVLQSPMYTATLLHITRCDTSSRRRISSFHTDASQLHQDHGIQERASTGSNITAVQSHELKELAKTTVILQLEARYSLHGIWTCFTSHIDRRKCHRDRSGSCHTSSLKYVWCKSRIRTASKLLNV
jgi:hypothetical protein